MIIRLDQIPADGLTLNEDRPVEWLSNFPDLIDGKGMSAAGEVRFRLKVDRMGDQVHLKGNISVPVKTECSRCLEEVVKDVQAPVDIVLVPEEPGNEGEEAEDEGYGTYRGEEIDIADHLRGQLALYFPWRFLCKPDCKGLCPHCGVNLNKETCNCEENKMDPRWSELKKLKT